MQDRRTLINIFYHRTNILDWFCKFSLTIHKEVENFINANTQELAKEKWLCPLSGKKFRAKDFVVKHIHNKHADKLEAVRLEVCIFYYKPYYPNFI